VPDRNGKIFYTSITSLSHISKNAWQQALSKTALLQTRNKFCIQPPANTGQAPLQVQSLQLSPQGAVSYSVFSCFVLNFRFIFPLLIRLYSCSI
jgi:hypothetical protein